MEKTNKEQSDKHQSEDAKKLEGLPTETSPYVQYKDLEDYKLQGYGTQGHSDPEPGRGAGDTDAPTESGGAPVSKNPGSATDAPGHPGVP
ncbi:hypothetical protein RND81_13G192600 [Saponaria officinalis]|uniref:Late embryogenesis abundant protein, LEA-18 n=1 Tax=Saponaria officinalis TaxID=3572 RepID=A0AAW1GZW1_SAPOF